jgi:excisionase family DNA binding protein
MRFFTTGEVAKELGVSKRSVERWVRDGSVPAIRIRSTVRIPDTVIGSGSIVAECVIDERSTNRAILLQQLHTAAHFLESAAEIFDQRVMDYLDEAVALDVLLVDRLDAVMAELHTFRTSLREVWQAIGEAEPTDVRLLDCGQVTKFAGGSVA